MTQFVETPQSETDKYGHSKEYKKAKLDAIRAHHAGLINDLGISPLDFNMKMPFYDKQGRYVVGLFASEFKKDKGFFFELIDRYLDPLEEDRKVYRIARNDNFMEEYEMSERGTSWLVPVDELRVINPSSVAVSKDGILSNDKVFSTAGAAPVTSRPAPTFTSKPQPVAGPKPVLAPPPPPPPSAQEETDAPYSQMTIRDYIAIHTGKPVSNKAWLNKLILQDTPLPF